jgi:aldose 1-epimerase
MDSEALELRDSRARLLVSPHGGAAILRYDALIPGRSPLPLMKPTEGGPAFGCQLLVPFSNRISGGSFEFDGRFHPIAPNVPGEAFPIHGDGFQKSWRVARQDTATADLMLDDGAIGPYRYTARVIYSLNDGALTATLTVENRAPIRLPYGLGFHPWFPRRRGTTLRAKAERVWLEDERHLPTGVALVSAHQALDFSRAAPLPTAWVNNGFDGWDGRAEIVQPEDVIALAVEASPELRVYILYSPGPDASFFCFEPVSHVVDAHHGEGLTALASGEKMSVSMRLDWGTVSTEGNWNGWQADRVDR